MQRERTTNNAENLIWIDLEMTGLVPASDRIIEVAIIVTDKHLNTIAESPSWAVHQPRAVFDAMDKWNKNMHGKSGLVDRCLESSLTEAAAEKLALNFLAEHTLHGISPMCGNTVCQDRRFLSNYMPTLEAYFSHRHFDVSSFKIAGLLWYGKRFAFEKCSAHTALSDIRESIEEMRFYRDNMLIPPA